MTGQGAGGRMRGISASSSQGQTSDRGMPQQQRQQQQQQQNLQRDMDNQMGGQRPIGTRGRGPRQSRGGRGRALAKPRMPSGPPGPGGLASTVAPPPTPVATTKLTFDAEFDFEQANAEFQELESKMAKTKITTPVGLPVTAAVVTTNAVVVDDTAAVPNGDEKKDDSGNETAVGEGEQDEDNAIFYDKEKSFFDKISM